MQASAVRIRLASPGDARRIAELSRDEIERGLHWRWTPARVLRALADASTNVVVAHDAGALVGFAIMTYRDAEAELLLLAVAAAHRRRGVGRALLDWLERTARVAGTDLVFLDARAANAGARAFYAALGYRELACLRDRYAPAVHGVRIGKDLALPAAP